MFNQLWKMGDTADFNLSTHAGQAWMNIRTPLGHHNGHPPQHPTYQPQTSTPTKDQYPPHTLTLHLAPTTIAALLTSTDNSGEKQLWPLTTLKLTLM